MSFGLFPQVAQCQTAVCSQIKRFPTANDIFIAYLGTPDIRQRLIYSSSLIQGGFDESTTDLRVNVKGWLERQVTNISS